MLCFVLQQQIQSVGGEKMLIVSGQCRLACFSTQLAVVVVMKVCTSVEGTMLLLVTVSQTLDYDR